MLYRYRHQPFKAIYLAGQFVVTLLRIPLWILLSNPYVRLFESNTPDNFLEYSLGHGVLGNYEAFRELS